MEASSKAMRSAWSSPLHHIKSLNLIPEENEEEEDFDPNISVSSSFALPHHPETRWKHNRLCDFFLKEQLHRRVIRVLFALTESMADIWEQFDFNYCFHFVNSTTTQDVLQPYVMEKPSIAVIGPTNSGKTTLLNVLLGKWWLPEEETPNTDVVWRISSGKRPQRLRRDIKTEEIVEGGGDWNIEAWINDGMTNEKALRQTEPSKEIFYDLKLPNELLSYGVDLWDTPSLNYDKWSMLEQLIFRRKNVIPIFVVDAQECFAEDRDVRFIKTIRTKHPSVPFLIVLGRIDVSLVQLRMDHCFELGNLDSDDEERVMKEVSKCEIMRIRVQIPAAKFHNLIAVTQDIGVISPDKVWEELSNENEKGSNNYRYTNQFNEFIELLLRTQGKRIQRPFFRIYARLMQAILCAKTCLKILQDDDFDKEQCLKDSRERVHKIASLRKSWTEFYNQTRAKYLKTLQEYLVEKAGEMIKSKEMTTNEKMESHITGVLVSQAIGAANAEVETKLYKKAQDCLKECLRTFEGSSEWIDGIIYDGTLKLPNDFLWDRSLIRAVPLREFILQFASRFRKGHETQRIQGLVSRIDYDRIMSTVFCFYDALNNDVQSLYMASKVADRNLSLTCNLKPIFPFSHNYFSCLESRINFLSILADTLDKVHKGQLLKIENSDSFFIGPLPVGEKSSNRVAYALSLQQNRIKDIEKSLQFVTRKFPIDHEIFLKPLDFSFDLRKHLLILYSDFGPSLHQLLNEEPLPETWNLQQAMDMAMDLHRASEYFLQATGNITGAPDWGPQFIMLKCINENWRPCVVLMGEAGRVTHYSKDEEAIHLPENFQKWKPHNLLAYQVIVAFWLFVMKTLIRPPSNPAKGSWKGFMNLFAKDDSMVTESVCWFFCSAFSSKSTKKDLAQLLKATSEKFKGLDCWTSDENEPKFDLNSETSSSFFLSQNDKLTSDSVMTTF